MKTDIIFDNLHIRCNQLLEIVARYESIQFADHRWDYLFQNRRKLAELKMIISTEIDDLLRKSELGR